MNLVFKEGEGAASISLKRKRKASHVGTYTPEPCKNCGYKPQQLSPAQIALYEGVTKGLGAIPKEIVLTEDAKETIRKAGAKARPFLDRLKENEMAEWLPTYHRLALSDPKSFAREPEMILGILAIDLDWSKGRVRDLDLVDHLNMNRTELINVLIANGHLPPWFWELEDEA